MSNPAGSKPPDGERLFIYVAIIVPLLLGAGVGLLLLHLNVREKAETDSVPGEPPRLIAPDHPRQLTNFALTDRTGRSVTQAELAGRVLVVDFLFTSCSQTCPIVNQCMAQIQGLLTTRPDVRLVSRTVDPRDDTVDALAKFGRKFGADTNRWLLLTGEKTQLYGLISNSFLAQDADDPFNYMPGNFSHTDRIALVDAHGNLQGFYDGLNTNTAEAVVEEISRLEK